MLTNNKVHISIHYYNLRHNKFMLTNNELQCLMQQKSQIIMIKSYILRKIPCKLLVINLG